MIVIIIFQKKCVWGKWNILGQKMCILITLDLRQEFFWILHSEKGQEVDESNDNGLYQKNFVHDKWAILGPKVAHPHNFGWALRIFLKFCRMKGANRYIKILLVVFREKKFIWCNFSFLALRPFFIV